MAKKQKMIEKRGVFHFLSEVSGRMKWNVAILLFVQVLQGICGICYALFLRDLIDAAVAGKKEEFLCRTGAFAALVFLQLALRGIQRFLEEFTRSGLENRLKSRFFGQLLCRDYGAVMIVHSGEWMNRLTNDTVVTADGMTEILPGMAGMMVKMMGALFMLILLSPQFVYLLVPGGVLLLLLSTAFRKVMKYLHRCIQEKDGILRMFLQETLGSLLIVRSYGVEQNIWAKACSKMDEHRKARMKRNHFSNICNLGFGMLMNGVYVLGAFFCGYGILMGTMSYGAFMAVFQLIGQVQSPFANISAYLPRYYAMLASAERLMEVESLPEVWEKQVSFSRFEKNEMKTKEQAQAFYAEEFLGMGFNRASFRYFPPAQGVLDFASKEGMPVVLSEISLEIHKGEFVAFTGASGCGKSTILKLFMCLYPLDRGERYLLTQKGKSELNEKWQKLFAYVPQGNYLMSGTVREIVAFADQTDMCNQKRISRALRIACAEEFVYLMENREDTLLGEHGLGLSEGQMQRLAIAGAVFSEHPILMLDECTSALDTETEARLLTNLKRMTDKTVLIVTHRAAALEICDKIVDFSDSGCKIRTKL